MTAKRVASAHKPVPTIAAALSDTRDFVKRAERLAEGINRLHPKQRQQDVESLLWLAISVGLDELEARYAKEAPP